MNSSRLPIAVLLAFLLVVGFVSYGESTKETGQDTRPNILLIVVDDLGFNDLSVFGSEIDTPNIDALANGGVLLNDFNVAPTCSPTRAMLMSSADTHVSGLGWMAEVRPPWVEGKPGYEGYLNDRVAAMPALLADAGYNTYMTGKWHLGLSEERSPTARGFQRTFVLANAGAGAFSNQLAMLPFDPIIYRENGKQVETLPDDFYSTRAYSRKMIEFINSDLDDGKPFFGYVAYTAPHWPLQAPQESIAKYQDTYLEGYDVIKERRLARLKELGHYEDDIEPFPRMLSGKPWDELSEEERRYSAKSMAIYAAMVDDLDVYIGELVDHLKAIGEYENTLILFMSDNGPEGNNMTKTPGMPEYLAECCDNSYENIGNADSYIVLGPDWAQAGNVPLRTFKSHTSQGGIRVPAIAHFGGKYPAGTSTDEFLTVKDVLPTLLEVANAEHPGGQVYRGRKVVEMEGRSMHSHLLGQSDSVREVDDHVGWELFGRRAIRQGDWKAIFVSKSLFGENDVPPPVKTRVWQLYNLYEDPGEINDLAEQNPEKLTELIALWDDYVERNGVIIPQPREQH